MEYRYTELGRAIDGLQSTGTPLVSEGDGGYLPAGFTDDQGIYYFIPRLADLFGISLDQAINLFFGSLWLTGTLIALASFFIIFKHWSSRAIAAGGVLALLFVALHYRDVYSAFFFAVTTTVPLFLVLDVCKPKSPLLYFASLAWSGLMLGYCNFVRCYSGVGVLLFLFAWIFLKKSWAKREKVLFAAALIFFSLIPSLHFKRLVHQRDAFLTTAQPAYQSITVTHPIWHTVYVGLGYLKNEYNIQYLDDYARNTVHSIDPTAAYCSDEYSQILKNQFFKIVRENPWFIIKTFLAKFLILILKSLFFVNFGLFFYFSLKPSLETIFPFLAAGSFYAIPGLLALPLNCYVFGMLSIAALFGIFMTGLGLDKYFINNEEFNIA